MHRATYSIIYMYIIYIYTCICIQNVQTIRTCIHTCERSPSQWRFPDLPIPLHVRNIFFNSSWGSFLCSGPLLYYAVLEGLGSNDERLHSSTENQQKLSKLFGRRERHKAMTTALETYHDMTSPRLALPYLSFLQYIPYIYI